MRGLLIGTLGSLLPLAMGAAIALLAFRMPIKSALAVGAVFGPTSMGVALVVLKKGNVLSSPMGQMIVAAAVVDDVLALVILSELKVCLAARCSLLAGCGGVECNQLLLCCAVLCCAQALTDPAPIEFAAPVSFHCCISAYGTVS